MTSSDQRENDQLEIERLGGLAGMGLPGSHLRSRAVLAWSALSDAEREGVAALFAAPPGGRRPPPPGADRFRYRVILQRHGVRREIEVGEGELSESLQAQVQDELV